MSGWTIGGLWWEMKGWVGIVDVVQAAAVNCEWGTLGLSYGVEIALACILLYTIS